MVTDASTEEGGASIWHWNKVRKDCGSLANGPGSGQTSVTDVRAGAPRSSRSSCLRRAMATPAKRGNPVVERLERSRGVCARGAPHATPQSLVVVLLAQLSTARKP